MLQSINMQAPGEWQFKIYPANIDETRQPDEAPAHYVLRLAETKARAVAEQAEPGWLVLAADTTVVDPSPSGPRILEKPATQAEAFSMLAQLRGRTHQVFTALSVYDRVKNQLHSDLCITDVPMRSYTDEEIFIYVSSGDPMDKAGAYGIQNPIFHPVDHLKGCYASVMGLPLCHLQRTLRRFGVNPSVNLSQPCQKALNYKCPVFSAVLGYQPPYNHG